jgi:prepilin-type N-terminal cleavage/methylation domain-containing protein
MLKLTQKPFQLNMLKKNRLNQNLRISARQGAKPGFSLIELLIVISLIGALTLLGMPLFRDFIDYSSLKNDAWLLLSDLRSYRQLAIIEHFDYAFVFDVNSDSYSIEKRDSANGALLETIANRSINNDIVQAIDTTFKPKGQAEPAATINIQGKNPSEQMTITVFSTTGLSKMTGP